ncbi:hypothetical protein BDW75DRAFT_218558 [Aspergillus navahoensis]
MQPTVFPLVLTLFLTPALALALAAPKLPADLGLEKRQTQCPMLPCDENTAILCSLLNCGTCEGGVCTGTTSEDSEADPGSVDLTGLTGAIPSSLPIDLSALTGSIASAAGAGPSINSIDSTALTSPIPSSLPIDLAALSGLVGPTASTDLNDSSA